VGESSLQCPILPSSVSQDAVGVISKQHIMQSPGLNRVWHQAGGKSGGATAAESEGVARRSRKRERPAGESVDDSRWAIKRRLAALSHDVEVLTQHVSFLFRISLHWRLTQ